MVIFTSSETVKHFYWIRKNKIEFVKKIRLKEMEILTIMEMRIAKFQNKRGHKVKVNDSKYLVFKSIDHFKKIEELERMVFDLVKYALFGEDEDKQYVILLRMLSIENYLKSLPLTKIKLFDENFDSYRDAIEEEDYNCPFEMKFPTLGYFFMSIHLFEEYSNYKLFTKKLKTEEVKEKYRDLCKAIDEVLLFNFN